MVRETGKADNASMARVVVIHWTGAEAARRVEQLQRAGFAADESQPQGPKDLRLYREKPPEAFVIDLSRAPAKGRDVGLFLRGQKATRASALVFAGGDKEKVEALRCLLPDASYAGWATIPRTRAKALASPPARPVTPGAMAGYAGTPLARKLGFKAGSVMLLVGAPARFERTMEPLPEGARVVERAREADRVLLFATSLEELARRFGPAAKAVRSGGGMWIVWPKKTSGVKSDLSQTVVRKLGLDAGWVDYKICAIDATWSGLLFARRG
jgi:hypothetical protein